MEYCTVLYCIAVNSIIMRFSMLYRTVYTVGYCATTMYCWSSYCTVLPDVSDMTEICSYLKNDALMSETWRYHFRTVTQWTTHSSGTVPIFIKGLVNTNTVLYMYLYCTVLYCSGLIDEFWKDSSRSVMLRIRTNVLLLLVWQCVWLWMRCGGTGMQHCYLLYGDVVVVEHSYSTVQYSTVMHRDMV
jgi:hypothetical protein